jgi:phage-related protein
LGAPLELGDIQRDDNTEVAKIKCSVSNVAQAISGIIGTNGDVITNADCYLYQVFLDVSTNAILTDYTQLVFFGKANNLNITDELASIDIDMPLGGYEQKAPKMNYNTNCSWRKFKDARCAYTGDEVTCDRTITTCKRYGNIENFGGFPTMYKGSIIKA